MKSAVALSVIGVLAASGGFVAGAAWKATQAPGGPGRGSAGAPGATLNVGGTTALNKANAAAASAAISKNDTVQAFLKKYGLDSGGPLSPERMKEAVTEALRETDPIKSQMLFARLMEDLTAENAPQVLAMLRENVAGFDSMRYMGMLSYAWGSADPLAAMEALNQNGDRGGRFSQSSVVAGWASKDPDAAIAWLEKYEGENKGWLSNSLVDGLAKSDPEKALKLALGLKDAGERGRAAETLAREMIRSGGVEKATQWLSSLTDNDMKRSAFDTITDQYLRSDLNKAVDFAKSHASDEYAANAIGTVAEAVGRKDVQHGLQLANSLTGKAQARAYAEVIGEWMDKDKGAQSVEASAYVSKMPPGDARDLSASTIARRVVGDDPASAIAWANSIANTETRQETYVDIGRRYTRTNPQEAAAWLATSGLSAAVQQQITAPPEDRGRWGGPGGGGPPGFGGGGGGFRGGRGR